MNCAPTIVIMAKAPRPGLVKTRLSPILGPYGCARLQARLLAKSIEVAKTVAPSSTYVAFYPIDAHEEMRRRIPSAVEIFAQNGTNIGERMLNAAKHVRVHQRGPIIIIGTDIPTIDKNHLRSAADQLADGYDLVFGPTYDGGYYLVGFSKIYRGIFEIDPKYWSGPEVLHKSIEIGLSLNLNIATTEQLRDLDTRDDLFALLRDATLPSELRQILEEGLSKSYSEVVNERQLLPQRKIGK